MPKQKSRLCVHLKSLFIPYAITKAFIDISVPLLYTINCLIKLNLILEVV